MTDHPHVLNVMLLVLNARVLVIIIVNNVPLTILWILYNPIFAFLNAPNLNMEIV